MRKRDGKIAAGTTNAEAFMSSADKLPELPSAKAVQPAHAILDRSGVGYTTRLSWESKMLRFDRCCPVALIASFVCLLAFASSSVTQEPGIGESASWIKADSKVIIVAEVAGYLDGPERERIAEISGLHPIVVTHELSNAEGFSGLKPSDVARIVVSEELPAGFVVAVETVKPSQAEGALSQKLTPGVTPTAIAPGRYYAGDKFGLLTLPSQVALASTPAAIQAVVTRLSSTPEQTTVLPEFAGVDPALVDFFVRPGVLDGHPELAALPPQAAALLKASAWRVRFEPAKSLTFRCIAEYADEATADAGVESLKFIAAQLATYMDMCEQNIPPALEGFAKEFPGAEKLAPPFVQVLHAAKAALQSPQVTREGTTATMVCDIASDHPVSDAILLLSLMPRAAQ
jgi:hypothetical protein